MYAEKRGRDSSVRFFVEQSRSRGSFLTAHAPLATIYVYTDLPPETRGFISERELEQSPRAFKSVENVSKKERGKRHHY